MKKDGRSFAAHPGKKAENEKEESSDPKNSQPAKDVRARFPHLNKKKVKNVD